MLNHQSESGHPTARERIITAAIGLFGRHGRNAVSTRQIGACADTQISTIAYHFGTKEGLYRACAERVAELTRRQTEATIEMVRLACPPDTFASEGPAALRALLLGILHIVVQDDTEDHARFILREQIEPTEVAGLIFDQVVGPVIDEVARLIGITSANEMTTQEERVRAFSLIGQILVHRFSASAARGSGGWTDMNEGARRIIRHVVAEHVDGTIDRLQNGAQSISTIVSANATPAHDNRSPGQAR